MMEKSPWLVLSCMTFGKHALQESQNQYQQSLQFFPQFRAYYWKGTFCSFFSSSFLGRRGAADQQTSATLRWRKHVGGPRCTEAPTHSMTYKQTRKYKIEQRSEAGTGVMCPCLRVPVKYDQPQERGAATYDWKCILGGGAALPALAS